MIDIAVIGGGPAGLTAGLYAGRGGASVELFEEAFTGGQAAKTIQIDNYPAFPSGVPGSELGMLMEQQAKRFGLQVREGAVEELALTPAIKRLRFEGEWIEARAVVLCMGAAPRKLGLHREEALEGMGISYCATCDGAFFRGKHVAVNGGGDTALSDALYLARFANKVSLIHRRDALRGGMALQKAVFAEEKIEVLWNSVVEELIGESSLQGLRLRNTKTNDSMELAVAALFVAIGVEPRTELVRGHLELNEQGYILTDAHMRASLPGVYAAGDVRETPLRQVVTAVSDGAIAATAALEYLAMNQAQANVQ